MDQIMTICCKCKEHGWRCEESRKIVYEDTRGNKYCLFHAPPDEKKDNQGRPLNRDNFNTAFFDLVKKKSEENRDALCHLTGIVFHGDIDFGKHYSKEIVPKMNLDHSFFTGKVSFCGLGIKEASFNNARFEETANFSHVLFNSQASFHSAVFHKRVDFSNSEFCEGGMFIAAEYDDVAWFEKCTFSGDMLLHSARAHSNAFRMHNLDESSLSYLRLKRLDVEHFSFSECVRWPKHFGFENEKHTSIRTLEELYRALKQKAIEQHDHLQASHWHFCEKLMQLKQLFDNERSNNLLEEVEDRDAKWLDRAKAWFKLLWHRPHWQKLTLTGLYWATSGFGERAVRAGVWLLALIVLSFVLNATPQPMDWNSMWGATAANATLATIPFAKDIPGDGWVKAGRGLWQFLIAIQFTLFALAVRNRFRR
ncbi:pentapeptide repeat-containing protein [Humidesulfovibrio sp.]